MINFGVTHNVRRDASPFSIPAVQVVKLFVLTCLVRSAFAQYKEGEAAREVYWICVRSGTGVN